MFVPLPIIFDLKNAFNVFHLLLSELFLVDFVFHRNLQDIFILPLIPHMIILSLEICSFIFLLLTSKLELVSIPEQKMTSWPVFAASRRPGFPDLGAETRATLPREPGSASLRGRPRLPHTWPRCPGGTLPRPASPRRHAPAPCAAPAARSRGPCLVSAYLSTPLRLGSQSCFASHVTEFAF